MAAAAVMRPMKGSRLQDVFPSRPSTMQFSDIDSAFPLQEYIAYLVQQDPHNVEAIVNLPGPRTTPESSPQPDEKDSSVDESCWIYEQLRRLAQDLTHPLITSLQGECNRQTCPEMKAGEWLYLCVAHGTGPSSTMEPCCAIDYITHTLDSATALLNSPRAFPSRLQIPAASTRQFPSLARRLSRIFAHAYLHHREAFEQSEAESSLYARFLLLAKKFDLVPAEFLVLTGGPSAAAEPVSQPAAHSPSSSQPSTQTTSEPYPSWTSTSSSPPSQTVGPPVPAGISLPMQRTSASVQAAEPTQQGSPASFAHMTIKGGGITSDADRRALLNRSRTDTMYMRDFDLSEFAAAAGDAMAAVNAENGGQEQSEKTEITEDAGEHDDEFVEVDHEPEEAIHDDEEPEEVPNEVGPGAEEPAPTPGAHVPSLPSEPTAESKAVDEVDTALQEEQEHEKAEGIPAVEPSPEAGVADDKDDDELHITLERGEVKAVPAHLGLDSEAPEQGEEGEELTWGGEPHATEGEAEEEH